MVLSIGHGGISDIKDHISSYKHKRSVESSSKTEPLTNFFQPRDHVRNEKVVAAELTFAYHIVKHHQSFVSADYVNKLLPKMFFDSKIVGEYSTARTKTERLITHVLAPHTIQNVLNDLKNCSFYGISTDASNHKSDKIFPLLIQYFTLNGMKIKLLKTESLKGESSEIVANYIADILKNLGIELEKCNAFGADNANVNFGGRLQRGSNNVFTRLKSLLGCNLEAVGCPAHVLNNALHAAGDKLSCDAEQIIHAIHKYFSIYTV